MSEESRREVRAGLEPSLALAKADRYQEAVDALGLLDNRNSPRALNYRGYATRKLGRINEGIGCR
jgi:hypothetical protein